MAESMKGLKRTCRCAELNETNIGQTVTVMGWVAKNRNKGGICFVDLRDRSGILQIIFEEDKAGSEGFAKAGSLRSEYVIAVTGEVAARAGAAYVSPFLGRLDDISQPGIELIRTISDIFMNYPEIETEIIAASVRNPIHVTDCALAGADIATVPYSVIEQMTKHPLTTAGIEKFVKDYEAVFGKQN